METLRLAPTIKCPAAAVSLRQGFIIKHEYETWYMNRFFAQVNIHNDNLWILIRMLLQTIPYVLSMTITTGDDDFYATNSVSRVELLNELQPFHLELCQDTALEISFVFMTSDSTELLYITRGKTIEYWSMDESLFRQTMAAFGIPELDSFQVIDTLDVETKTLVSLVPQATQTLDLVEHIMEVSRCIS